MFDMELHLDIDGGELVPAILQVPDATGPFPAVLVLHGFSSDKERMADSIGRGLVARGVASLAIDLPLHGSREGGLDALSFRNPLAVVQAWRLAVREAHRAIDFLAEHRSVDANRIGIAGYSLGAYLALIVAANSKLIKAVTLAAGGDLPEQTPFASLVRTVADPQRAARALAGRPLLMVNGRYDRRVLPDQARSLYEAASEPKELRWYDGGHWPPATAINGAAEWLARILRATAPAVDPAPGRVAIS